LALSESTIRKLKQILKKNEIINLYLFYILNVIGIRFISPFSVKKLYLMMYRKMVLLDWVRK
jgi:hypothetical protein